jgi:hypothetical protein
MIYGEKFRLHFSATDALAAKNTHGLTPNTLNIFSMRQIRAIRIA